MKLELYYATNRNHEGKDRWNPTGYGKKFSEDGIENLRFGKLSVDTDETKIKELIEKKVGPAGFGDGISLSEHLSKCAENAQIQPFKESIEKNISETSQKKAVLGSSNLFNELYEIMRKTTDVVVYVHGFNVSWAEAVGSALALQVMLNHPQIKDSSQEARVVLFSWPSDGMALPFVSYKSDRTEAMGSGAAIGRGFLKLRDYLANLRDRANQAEKQLCGQDIHLLCHSMGNYLLENALAKTWEFTPGNALPRIFEHVFLCAPDVDDDALEPEKGLEKVTQICRQVTLYHNKKDKAMVISDYTKGNPERLGGAGAAHPNQLHAKVHQVDCSDVVMDFTGHSYYLTGSIIQDIRMSIDGFSLEDKSRMRELSGALNNVWKMKPVK